MKKYIYAIIGLIVAIVIVYMVEAFVLWDLNPMNWGKNERATLFLLVIIFWQLIPWFMRPYTPKNYDD